MDYSKWKKIFYILMIISLILNITSRVFGASLNDYFVNNISLEKNQTSISLGSANYGGVRTIQIPSFLYDYNNILICMNVNQYSTSNKQGIIIFSNDKILVDNTGKIFGLPNKDYYYLTAQFNTNPNFSSYTLSNFTKNNSNNIYWNGYLNSNSNYGYTALYGRIYNYSSQDDVIIDATPFNPPQFDQSDSEIQSLNFDSLFINPRDFGIENKLYLKILEITNVVQDNNDGSQNIYYFNDLTFALNKKSQYMKEFFDSGTYYYSIPYSALKLKKDTSYYFILTSSSKQLDNYIGQIHEDDIIFDVVLANTTGIVTTDDEILHNLLNKYPSENTEQDIINNVPNSTNGFFNIDEHEDITNMGFNHIFTTIYNITHHTNSNGGENIPPITITIPFINKTFQISFQDMYTHINSSIGGRAFISLMYTIYYFIVSWYIVNDIRKIIEHIKSGDITTHTDTNIKAEML